MCAAGKHSDRLRCFRLISGLVCYLCGCAAVFPVEFHIPTLPSWLQHTSWLAPGADIKQLLVTMMQRLATAAEDEEEGEGGEGGGEGKAGGTFELLTNHLATLHPQEV